MKLGIMEFGYLESAFSSIGKVSDIADFAVLADELNFSRFWLSEHHHNYSQSSWSNPQFLVPLLLNMTARIKVGIAGILINYYSPYEVAMNFKLLANLFPGRTDLGFANGTLPMNIGSLLTQKTLEKHPDDFYKKITTLANMLQEETTFHEKEQIIIPPYKGGIPDLFMLSSSSLKFDFCLDHQLHCAHSLFHSHDARTVLCKSRIAAFKDQFKERYGYTPAFILAFKGICAADDATARQHHQQAAQSVYGASFFNNLVVGTPETFVEELGALEEEFGVDEFVYLDCHMDIEQKKEALYLLSERFNITHS